MFFLPSVTKTSASFSNYSLINGVAILHPNRSILIRKREFSVPSKYGQRELDHPIFALGFVYT